MRHGNKNNSLSRTSAHRKALLSNMACSLIEHKRINTTVAKAKALRVYLEPLLTKSKTDSTHSRRIVFRYLQSKEATTELFREVAPKIADRPGGYLRIIRIGNRLGDNAEMCMIELVDFNDLMTKEPKEKKTRRSRRGSGSSDSAETKTEEKSADVSNEKEEKPKAKKEAPKAAKKADDTKEAPKAEAKKETPKKVEKNEDKKDKK
jgi:large subunit ribosomal protein L17